MSAYVFQESFGGSEVLEVRDGPEPHARPGQVRVRVAAAGLNPVDAKVASVPATASRNDVAPPMGFGHDYAGTIDEVGDGVEEFSVGDRVFGGARAHAVAEYVVVDVSSETPEHTPDGVDDMTAATISIAARTAVAAIDTAGLGEDDTVLVGGAAGGVGVYVVQLARARGARVLGTASAASAEFLRSLGAEPVEYGDGLVGRVSELAPGGVDAAIDLHGSATAEAALELGVPGERIATIAAHPPVEGTRPTGGGEAPASALQDVAAAIAAGGIRVPIAATFPIARIRDAVDLVSGGHVNGKVVVTP